MQKKKSASLKAAVLAAGLMLAAGCVSAQPIESGEHPPVELAAWTAYWDDANGRGEYKAVRKSLASVSCFAAYYDAEDALVVPQETREQAEEIRKKTPVYLSVTNDWRAKNGKAVEKDKELLARIFASEEKMDRQIDAMVSAAKELKCAGLELDYEGFWKDGALAQKYLQFTYRLSMACTRAGLDLRIVLEPSAPMDAPFVKGPAYIVMLYNLHGKHSGPGAKADGAFIEKTIRKMESLPPRRGVALATGGCLWEDYGLFGLKSGTRRFISEEEAVSLQEKHQAKAERDGESAALFYTFKDKGHETEVWYADSETLNAWITAAARAGITDISIWRLGGNMNIKAIHTK